MTLGCEYLYSGVSEGGNDGDGSIRLLGAPALRVNLCFEVVAEQGAAPGLCRADLVGRQSRGAAQVRSFQAGTVKVRAIQDGTGKLRSAEVRAFEVCVNKDGIPKLSATQVRTHEPG